MKKHIIYTIILFLAGISSAQIEDGSFAPNFIVDDVEGESHDLYSYLQDGHFVVIYFMATWSDPCWSYHNGATNGTDGEGALNVLFDEHSVENGGNVIILMVEGDPATNIECLIGGPGCNYTTHGDWSMDTPYPVIDNASVADMYEIADYPIVMTICPNGLVTETGTMTANQHWSFIENSSCPEMPANDAALQFLNTSSSCEESELLVDLLNLGVDNLSSLNIVSSGILPAVDLNWTGNLETFDSETLNFGFVSAIEGEEMSITISDIDENLENNSVSPVLGAVASSTHIHLELQSDTYPEDFSFHIFDENNTEVVSDGDWGSLGSDVLIERDYFLPETGCYRVRLEDSYGDGLYEGAYCLAYGIDGEGNDMELILDIPPGEFSEVENGTNVNEIVLNVLAKEEAIVFMEVYPNPASSSIKLSFVLAQASKSKMELVSARGDLVFSKSFGVLGRGKHLIDVDLSDVAAGAYTIFINCDGEFTGTRISVY